MAEPGKFCVKERLPWLFSKKHSPAYSGREWGWREKRKSSHSLIGAEPAAVNSMFRRGTTGSG